ncbi:MAG: type II secretion system protein F [Actinobacteria bacterium]|nr:MAG: type II secretion system protein F [Actinomycetota bacterium]
MDAIAALGAGPIFVIFFAAFFLASTVVVEALLPSRDRPRTASAETALLTRAVEIASQAAASRGVLDEIQTRLDRAGLPLRAGELIFFHFAAVVGAGLLAGLLTQNVVVVILAVFVGAAAPLVAIEIAHRRRQRRFHEQLPDTLTLIAGALKAGYSFLQAVDMVVTETPAPMSEEFKRVLAEAQLGLPVEKALDHMAERVDSTNFHWTVMAVKIQREVGGNLAEVLETLAGTVRERDALGRQIRTLTAEGRLSAIILYVLPVVVGTLLYVMNPRYLSVMFTNAAGISMLVVAAVMLVAGGVWLKKVVTIEV